MGFILAVAIFLGAGLMVWAVGVPRGLRWRRRGFRIASTGAPERAGFGPSSGTSDETEARTHRRMPFA